MTPMKPRVLRYGPFRFDLWGRRLFLGKRCVRLTPREFDLFERLVRARGGLVRAETLLKTIWHRTAESGYKVDKRTLHVHVHNIKVKLKGRASCLVSESGVGYRLRNPGRTK